MRPDVIENRRIFPLFLKASLIKGARLVFIDESSFSSRHLKFRSWVSLDNPSHITLPTSSRSVTAISALFDDGTLLTQLRIGTNTEEELLLFLLRMEDWIREDKGPGFIEFRRKLVIIMDNAGIHVTQSIKNFFVSCAFQGVTLPQYSPQMNPIEKVFSLVKKALV